MSSRLGARARQLAVVFLTVLAAPAPAHAGSGPTSLRVDWAVDGAVTGLALATWGVSSLAQDRLVPPRCRWCTAPGFDSDVRRDLRWSSTGAASALSTALALSIPAGFAAYDLVSARDAGGGRATAEDVLVVAEAVALTGVVTQIAKFAFARQRPFALGSSVSDSDARLSFWSEHVSVAFAAAAAGGAVAERRGYRGWPWVYGLGFTVAAATGYFRMAADQHWLSDVLAGAVAGTAVGLAVPWLHRGAAGGRVSLAVIPGGVAISGRL